MNINIIEAKSKLISNNSFQFLWSFLQMVIAFLLIFVIMYFSLLLLKKLANPRMLLRGNKDIIELISFFPLDQKKKLFIVRVINDYYLIGVSENSINLLTILLKDDVEKSLAERVSKNVDKPINNFLSTLNKIKERYKKRS